MKYGLAIVVVASVICVSCAQPQHPQRRLVCIGIKDYIGDCEILANQGDIKAAKELANYYRSDQLRAYDWIKKAADLGDAPSMRQMYDAYYSGTTVPKNEVAAEEYLQKAVAARAEWATLLVARRNESADQQGSMNVYLQLAQAGNCFAQAKVSRAYYSGYVVTKNMTEAYFWGLEATSGGYQRSSEYHERTGLFSDDSNGERLFNISRNCYSLKALVPNVEGKLPADSRLLAQNAATSWRPGQPPPQLPPSSGEATQQTAPGRDQAAIPDAVVSNAAAKFDEAYNKGGMMGVHAAVLDCYKGLQPGADFTSEGFCVALDAVSASVDAGVTQQMKMPPTPGFEPQVVMDRIRSHLQPTVPSEDVGRVVASVVSRGNKYLVAILDQRNAGGKGNPAPVQQAAQAAPAISVSPTLTTTDQTAEISGKIFSTGKIAAFQVDGSNAPLEADGRFSFRRAVQVGVSEIKLTATDEWGKAAEATIKVSRSLPASTGTIFRPLDPNHVKAKPDSTAIALIIGIERYKNAPPAEYAENDARQFYDYAVNALGVPPDRVKLLTGSGAERIDIEKALSTWVKPLVVRAQSNVYIYFSGHGLATADGSDLFLLPYDGDRDVLSDSAIRRAKLISTLVTAGAKSTTMFLDTCYSGGTRTGETLLASARPILVSAKEQGVPPSVTILAAAANDQLSSVLDPVRHGLFSYWLMRGLEGDAANAGHTLTAVQLESYLIEHVPPEAAKLGRAQMPQLIGDGGRVVSSW